MRLALLGGTGDVGKALALRLTRDTDVEVVIGSRSSEKATDAVDTYGAELEARGIDYSLTGVENARAAREADLVVLSVPPYYVEGTVEDVADALEPGTILVSPAVGMTGDETGLHYKPPSVGSVAELAASVAPAGVPTVGACTNLPAERLADLDEDVDMDTFVFGDEEDANETVADVIGSIRGIRVLDAGPLANAADVESLTPLLITMGRYNDDVDHAGVKLV